MGSGHRTGRSLAATQTKTNQALGAIPGHAGCRFGPRTAGTTRAARRQKTLQIPQTQQTPPSLRRALESKQTPPGRHSQKTKWSYLSAIPLAGLKTCVMTTPRVALPLSRKKVRDKPPV